jgi:hypothetical protein
MKMKRFFIMMLCICLTLGLLPMTTYAADSDTAIVGDFQVTGDSGGYSYDSTNHVLTFSTPGAFTVAMATDGAITTTDTIVVSDNADPDPVEITLDNVKIDATAITTCAFSIASGSTSDLWLVSENELVGGFECAGLQVSENATLNIDASSTVDSLTATGGIGGDDPSGGGAGIGSSYYNNGGTISIDGGNVIANGGECIGTGLGGGAGIGGGCLGKVSDISISGGKVTSNGGEDAAGIGGGTGSVSGHITITGGQATAYGGNGGAGIGGGSYGDGGIVIINGGRVSAYGGSQGAGIGGGYAAAGDGDGGTVDIGGGIVNAYGDDGGAGIGGGGGNEGGDGGTVNIGGGTVNSCGDDGGAGIGGGKGTSGGFHGDGGSVTISGGVVTAIGSSAGEGIGSGSSGSSDGSCTITGGSIFVSSMGPTTTNGSGSAIYLTTVSLKDGSGSLIGDEPIDALTATSNNAKYSYGLNDVSTSAGALYLWLPDGTKTTNAISSDLQYLGSVTTQTTSSQSIGVLSLLDMNVSPSGTGNPISGNLTVTFSQAMTATASSIALSDDGGSTNDFTLSSGNWSSGNTVYTTNYAGLSYNTTYTVVLSGFETPSGYAINTDKAHTFQTTAAASSSSSGGGGGSSAVTYTIKATSGEGGSISPSGSTAVTSGKSKTYTISAKDGYEIEDVLVDGKSAGAVSTYTFTDVKTTHTISVSFKEVIPTAVNPFSDMNESDWFYEDVMSLYQKGLMNGSEPGSFHPGGSMTRGMIVTVLLRLDGDTGSYPNSFTDVKSGAWYENAAAWANTNGITSGTGNGSFAPNRTLTREQLAVMLYNYAKFKGLDVSVGEDTNILSYADALTISDYAYPALQWACGAGIIQGDSKGNLNPKAPASRAEVAAILLRFIETM